MGNNLFHSTLKRPRSVTPYTPPPERSERCRWATICLHCTGTILSRASWRYSDDIQEFLGEVQALHVRTMRAERWPLRSDHCSVSAVPRSRHT